MNDETNEQARPTLPHHPRGMSKWAPITACPCFEGKEGNQNAEIGTKCHALFADALRAYKDSRKVPSEAEMSAMPLHEAGALRGAQQVIDNYWGDYPRIEMPVGILDSDIYGTPDYCALTERGCVVVDFKTFFNPGRDYFPQLEGYALAVIQKAYKFDEWEDKQAELVIIYGDKPDATEHCRVKFSDLRSRFEAVTKAFDERDSGKARPHQCNWCEICQNAPACTAWKAVAEHVSGELKDAPNPENWAVFTPARKAQLLVLAESVSKWATAVRDMAKADALNGETLEDAEHGIAFKLRESRGRLTPRVADLWNHAKVHGVDAQAFMACLSCSSTVATKLLQGTGMKKAEAEAVVKACSDEGKGTVSLVRAQA